MDQALEQLKEILRQCVIYRFWISLGVAALFSIIAYLVGSAPVQAQADQQTSVITKAANDVKQFAAPGIPNDQYKPIVEEKTGILTRDINSAWKQLYNRQAPLLTWPETVQQRFREWGPRWPENVAESAVELAKVDYIQAYPAYVDQVYQVFHPFNYETGTGIVAAPPKEALLGPFVFDPTKLPDLGTIWAGQQRLWIQRTVLEVIAQVNKRAKDWDSAIIRQINLLEVGTHSAQDQRSLAKGEQLEESEVIKAPDEKSTEDTAGGSASAGGGLAGSGASPEAMTKAKAGATESIFYIKPENDKGQYKILPVMLSVLIDQDHVQDLLVELENSPMSIQVTDFELQHPASRVVKPEKGTAASFSSYGESVMRYRMGGMGGYGGMMAGYSAMMSRMNSQYSRMGGRGVGMGGMGVGPAASDRKGIDKRSTNRVETRREETKAVETAKGLSLFDPYYDIVEVKVYGQARLYNPPPADAETEPSLGETAAVAATTGELAKGDTSSSEPTIKVEAEKAEPAKAEAANDEPAKQAQAAPMSPQP